MNVAGCVLSAFKDRNGHHYSESALGAQNPQIHMVNSD